MLTNEAVNWRRRRIHFGLFLFGFIIYLWFGQKNVFVYSIPNFTIFYLADIKRIQIYILMHTQRKLYLAPKTESELWTKQHF